MVHEVTGGWARRRAERTEAIVAAGLRLVADNGLDGLTVGRLSRAVGMTPGALYRYFESKDAILAELNHRVVSRWSARFAEVQAALPDAPLPRLAALGLTFAALAEREPEALALVALTAADPRVLVPSPEPRHMPALIGILDVIASVIAAATGAPAARSRATSLVFGLLGVLQTRKLARFDDVFAPSALAARLTRDLLVGWGATPDAADVAFRDAADAVATVFPASPGGA